MIGCILGAADCFGSYLSTCSSCMHSGKPILELYYCMLVYHKDGVHVLYDAVFFTAPARSSEDGGIP
jgi:hypothetical protein